MEFLTDFTLQELEARLAELGVEKWRARPILLWVHRRNAVSFDEMTDLSLELREELKKHFSVYKTQVKASHPSPDGTTKHLVGLEDGDVIETVLIPEEDRRTVCVSTQVGCPVKCVFCASGLNGLKRNLSAGEISEQVLHVKRAMGAEEPDHVVDRGRPGAASGAGKAERDAEPGAVPARAERHDPG
jgi:23S rRNA (adenine2503-C2)-methyltransferase